MIIGIDLGTTHSVAAYMADDGPRLIRNALGEVLTPSVVGIDDDGKVLVGRTAKEYQVLHPERCASVFKRHMGSDWSVELAGRRFTAEQLSSLVLRALKEDAEAHFRHPVERAVITVPAYFNDLQRKATLRAGQLAGLKVERIINEPTAAAVAYGFHEEQGDKILVVFDLGGGTFDVSVVEIFERAIEVRSSAGEAILGGEDFTRTLAARVLEARGLTFERTELEAPALVARLIQHCERAKCLLSKAEQATVRLPEKDGEIKEGAAEVVVTRAQFQKWTEHILNRIELPIRRGLGDAGVNRHQVNEVILVGGATRMPAVRQRVEELFQRPPQCRLNPDEVVAYGAAVQAGLIGKNKGLDDFVVTDVAPFTLGIETTKRIGLEFRGGYYLPIIHRNTTIPVSRVERVATLHANQTEVSVVVYQGEARLVKDNLPLGELSLKGIPRGPAGQQVDVRFTYDLNGVLEVEATIVETQKKATLVIARHAKDLTPEQVAQAVAQMAALKTHPREEAVNRFLLGRAERLYRELSLFEREQLGELLDGFEDALERRDAAAIERFRDALQQALDQLEPDHGEEDS